MRRIAAILVMGMAVMSAVAQTPAVQKLKFDVASVRPCKPGESGGGMRPAPGGQRYVVNCAPLKSIMWVSYLIQPDQIVGGPDWINNDDYYVEGSASQPSTLGELKAMMQDAIAERFQLRFHRETRDLEAYVLSLEKNGPKGLREHTPTNGSDVAINQPLDGLHEKWTAKSASMTFFVWRLGLKMDRPVVDQTGLRAAGYDFEFSFTNEIPPEHAAEFQGVDTSGPTIFQALRGQLGLTLDGRKGPVEVLVIDHVERPSEN